MNGLFREESRHDAAMDKIALLREEEEERRRMHEDYLRWHPEKTENEED